MKKLLNIFGAFTMLSASSLLFTGCDDIEPPPKGQSSSFEVDVEKAMQQGMRAAEEITNSPTFQKEMKETEQQVQQSVNKAFENISFE